MRHLSFQRPGDYLGSSAGVVYIFITVAGLSPEPVTPIASQNIGKLPAALLYTNSPGEHAASGKKLRNHKWNLTYATLHPSDHLVTFSAKAQPYEAH